jgi:hypothetical protein
MSLIKRLPNIITNQDVALLATQRSKISNFREFTIFTTLMEAIGINWSDNTTASKYNPVKRATVRYPYYMVLGYEGSVGSQSMQRLMYNQTGTSDGTGSDNLERVNSEIYLRYFYLAKNRLQLIKDGANLYQGALTNATDLSVDEKLSVVQKSFSYADFYKIMKFEKTGRVTFKDAAAYDVFMFIAHQVGFMFNTKVPLWGRAFETSPQGFAENYYYEFNNKGFVSTHVVADGAFPADVLVLTKEMMYNFLKFGAVAF